MDCAADSMLTTTPFFRPRDGCEPIPTISSWPSSRTSPSSATTLDVPMSRPTIILPLCTVDIAVSFSSIHGAVTGDPCARTGIRQPGDRQAVGMAQVDARDVRDRKSTRLNSSHVKISYAVFCLKKKRKVIHKPTTENRVKILSCM